MNWTKTGKWLTTIAAALTLAACGNGGSEDNGAGEDTTSETSGDFDASQTINVVSREAGSGTRDAFTEITGILDENDVDNTYAEASIQNSTGAVMSTVGGDPVSIGYISLGSLDDSVKAVTVEGAEATPEAIQADEYPIARPFNVAYAGELEPAAQDFWNFIFSPEGQAIVEEQGYIQTNEEFIQEYTADEAAEGTITIGGSTSVTPVIEAINDAYQEQNGNVQVDIISNGSGAGMTGAIDGTNDIGMASRELSEDEASQLESQPLAIDGIAVIVNNENPVEDLTVEQVRQIFTGEVTAWEEVIG